MADFVFVPVKFDKAAHKKRYEQVAAKDRIKIRSVAAKTPHSLPYYQPWQSQDRKTHDYDQQHDKHSNNKRSKPRKAAPAKPQNSPSVVLSQHGSSEELRILFDTLAQSIRPQDDLDLLTDSTTSEDDCDLGFSDSGDSRSLSPISDCLLPPKIKTGCIDPFWTFSVPYHPLLSQLIHYNLTYLHPSKWYSNDLTQRNLSHAFFSNMLPNPTFAYASALFSAEHMYASGFDRNHTLGDVDPIQRKDILWFRNATLSEINKALSRNLQGFEFDSCATAICSMAVCELAFGSVETYKAHMRGVKALVAHYGGLKKLHPVTYAIWKIKLDNLVPLQDANDGLQLFEIKSFNHSVAQEILSCD